MLGQKRNILIVDDESALREALFDKLTKNDFHVIQSKNGKEGLEAALQNKPDLILLDIQMPTMDGMAMLKALRADHWGQNVPVIMLTNLDSDYNAVEAFENLAYDYVIKSETSLDEVVLMVKEKLKIK